MKKVGIFLLLALICILHAEAQKKDKGNANPPVTTKEIVRNPTDPEDSIYNMALKYGDYEVAKNAIYSLMQKHPGNKSYLDTLTELYFSMGEYAQCILAGTDFLQGEDTANTEVMERVAVSQSSLNRFKEALELWDKLWRKSGNDQYAYQVAVNQYLLKRYGECAQTIDIILKDPNADKLTVNISGEQNRSQKVAMKAAANNLMGVILKELSKDDQAKESFEAALKLSPDFDLAKSNLDQMNKKETPKEEEVKPKTQIKKK